MLAAEDPEAMEGVQMMEETESIVEPTLVPEKRAERDHTKGVLWQHEQHKWEHRLASAEYAMASAKVTVVGALEDNLEVQEVLGLNTPEQGTVVRPG